jgi:hypothetical protein
MSKTKKIIFGVVSTLIALGIVAVILVLTDPFSMPSVAQRQQIDEILTERILRRYGYKENLTPFCAYEILRIKPGDGQTKVYAVYYCGGFFRGNGELKSVRYALEPIELTLSKAGDEYALDEYWVPERIVSDFSMEMPVDEESVAYIKVHFPKRAQHAEAYAQELLQASAAKAQPYFDLIEHGDSYRFTGTDVTVILSRAGDEYLLNDRTYPQLAQSGTYEKNRKHVELRAEDGSTYWFERYGTDLVFDATRSKGETAKLTEWHAGIFFDYGIETCTEKAIEQLSGSYLVDIDQDGEREICAGLYYGSGSILLVADEDAIYQTSCTGHVRFGWSEDNLVAMQPNVTRTNYYTIELGEQLTICNGEETVNHNTMPTYSAALDEYVYASLGEPVSTIREKGDFQHYSYIFAEK